MEVVGVAKRVRKHRVHREAFEAEQAKEMGADVGLPVR